MSIYSVRCSKEMFFFLLSIDQRLDHVKNWKGELEVKRSELAKEVDATETYLVRIEKRLQSLQDNLHIAQTTLANR
jgi:DNA-binding XRE family transcriptional regulator